jgi:hypothetical protein
MKSVPIYIFDSAKIEENESLGVKLNEEKCEIVDFIFNENHLSGFWIDTDIHDETHTKDIIFYLGGTTFRTPFSQYTINLFNSILNGRNTFLNS